VKIANPNPDQLGLTPIRSGQVLNPSGRNQYTYRDEAERNLDRWLQQTNGDHTNSEAIIDRLVEDAKRGRGYAMKLVLDRFLPAGEHERSGGSWHRRWGSHCSGGARREETGIK
jgi:hypothetical protein